MVQGELISEEEVSKGRSSIAAILEILAAHAPYKDDNGKIVYQWMKFTVKNASVATQIKRNRGYDARTFRDKDKDGNLMATFTLQACYKGPDFQAEFIPRLRKTKGSGSPV